MPIVDHNELLRILESTDVGLELAASALDSHRESSKQILGTLLAYASVLSKDRLEHLVDQMAMANMTESLRAEHFHQKHLIVQTLQVEA